MISDVKQSKNLSKMCFFGAIISVAGAFLKSDFQSAFIFLTIINVLNGVIFIPEVFKKWSFDNKE